MAPSDACSKRGSWADSGFRNESDALDGILMITLKQVLRQRGISYNRYRFPAIRFLQTNWLEEVWQLAMPDVAAQANQTVHGYADQEIDPHAQINV